MKDFSEVKIPVPWGHIAGKWWGSTTEQPIIALHGWQDNCGSFDNLAPLLAKNGLSVLCIDLPGHGFSSHFPKGQNYYIFWDGVHHLRRIVKHFKWSQITIIGHSLGGCIGFLYSATFQDDVKKFISLDAAGPCGRLPTEQLLDDFGTSIDKILSYENTVDLPCYSREQLLDIVVATYEGSIDRAGCEILLKRGIKKVPRKDGYILSRDLKLKDSSQEFMGINQVLDFASRITCEVMNIKANRSMVLHYTEYYSMILDATEKNAKKLERHMIPGTGHHFHLMDADKVAPLIIQFLTS
ncbi:probable serine hydrolase [Leptinotarsa decemlineata]|uniref:probable serine hydrolase n=1 Tax=Leptinotarsa decemlineata TaxID=7539 RepID=UPI000C25588E|nr:probable serine hydrolase [Leptinotarsa decemlineata]